jgi:DDE superfamily endonuclease
VHDGGREGALGELAAFRQELYHCLTARADALFELAEAVLCTDGPVRSLVGLSLAPEHRRGHGALYDAVNCGRIDFARLRTALAGLSLPRAADGRLVLAVDVSPWLRPDGATCPDRSFCHTYGRGKDEHRMIPGWPYSIVAALETGRTSWTALLDAIRLQPGADVAAVITAQIRDVVERLIAAGQWRNGDPEILVVLDAGYDAPRIAYLRRARAGRPDDHDGARRAGPAVRGLPVAEPLRAAAPCAPPARPVRSALAEPPAYRPVATDGAARAAALMAELL